VRLFTFQINAYEGVYADLEGINWNLSDCKDKKYTVSGDKSGALHPCPSGCSVKSTTCAMTPCMATRSSLVG
jgi:hypothetical protein